MRLAAVRHRGTVTLAVAEHSTPGSESARVVPADSGLATSVTALAGEGPDGVARLAAALPELPVADLADLEVLAPVPAPGKIVAIGLNYADHAAEGGHAVPESPIVFAKFPSSVLPPGGVIEWDTGVTAEVDYEAELAVVIGRAARRVSAADALGHVFGYTCLNDVSARDLQRGDGQWVRAKSLDTFCPMGPWLVTAEEIPDPQALAIRCRVGGDTLQDASTASMIFPVRELIARLSHSFTLDPGDVIATGTPPGVGAARTPPRLLKDGEVVEVEIDGIGRLTNTCRVTTR